MSVLEVQQLLARLYTDPFLLEEFLSDREGFCRRHVNGCGGFIGQLDSDQLEFFACSLRSKRAGEVKKLLPMTVRALGLEFEAEFNRYAATAIPTGERKHLADAMAFCEHLIGDAGKLDQIIKEAAAFELFGFTVQFDLRREGNAPVVVQVLPGRRPWLRLKRFASELSELSGLTGTQESLQQNRDRRRMHLFARLPGLRGVWYW